MPRSNSTFTTKFANSAATARATRASPVTISGCASVRSSAIIAGPVEGMASGARLLEPLEPERDLAHPAVQRRHVLRRLPQFAQERGGVVARLTFPRAIAHA